LSFFDIFLVTWLIGKGFAGWRPWTPCWIHCRTRHRRLTAYDT